MRVRPGACFPLLIGLAACRGAEEPAAATAGDLPGAAAAPATGRPPLREPAGAERRNERASPTPPVAAEHLRRWRTATPSVSPALELEVLHGLSEALIRVERALAAPDDDSGRSAPQRLAESLRRMRFEGDVRVLVLDGRGERVHDTEGLTGNAHGRLDVHGRSVYGSLAASATNQGLARCFDRVAPDGATARASVIAWTRLDGPGWLLCVEGREERAEPDG